MNTVPTSLNRAP